MISKKLSEGTGWIAILVALALCLTLLAFFTGCKTQALYLPDGHEAEAVRWMEQAVARTRGECSADDWKYKEYRWELPPAELHNGQWGDWIDDGRGGKIFVGGYSVGTKGSGKWKSVVFYTRERDMSRRGIWEAMNVLSGIKQGRIADGRNGWDWP